jgi:hypothetical protein
LLWRDGIYIHRCNQVERAGDLCARLNASRAVAVAAMRPRGRK